MSVLDASVVLKWFVAEIDSEKAEALRTEYFLGKRDIVVPDLILYEISNVLNYHPDFTPTDIKEALQTLFDIDIEIVTPTQTLISKAVDIANKNNVTSYDACYFALALELQTDFITADKKFYNKVVKDSKNIILLNEIK